MGLMTGGGSWIGSGGGSGGIYAGASPTTITVGGLPAGSAIAGQTYDQIFQAMLVPYIAPTFSAFSMVSQPTTVEVGSSIAGTKSFSFTFTTPGNITPNTLAIYDATTATALATGLPLTSPQSAAVGTITLSAPGIHSWQGKATNTLSTVFSSALFTVNWYWRLYYGTSASATLNAAGIAGLTSSALVPGFAGTDSFAAGNYKYFAWPDSFGSPTAATGFKDTSTGLAVAMATTLDDPFYSNVQNGWYYGLVSVTNAYSVTTNYRVYRSQNILGGSINIQVS